MSLKIASTTVRRREAGVSIVEALVALIILSVGMLGIAGLYLQSVQSNRTAQTRTTAVHLINDMGDRIRSNHTATSAYAVALGTAPAAVATDCASVNCTPAQAAAFDLRRWYDHAMVMLPKGPDGSNPQVGVQFFAGASAADPSRFVITAGWKEPGSTDVLTTSVEIVQLGGA